MTRLPRRLFELVLLLPLTIPLVSWAESAPSGEPSLGLPRLDELLVRGSKFEDQQQWQQAADLYERAIRLYPQEHTLRERWQKAERLFSLARRYNDKSFTQELLFLSESRALTLYREILRKIESHYVRDISLQQLVERGYRNLALALSEEIFIQHNFSVPSETDVTWLKQQLSLYPVRNMTTIGAALDEVEHASSLCRRSGMRHATPAILEFITAACESLDPYSTHLSPDRLRDLYSMIDGNFVGLGIEVRGNSQGLEIVSVLQDSPAADSGLRAGDTIVEVDGQKLAGLGAEAAANKLQGQEGTQVFLEVLSKDKRRFPLNVTRREVVVHSVTHAELLGNSTVGYIRLASFQKLTVGELKQAVHDLHDSGMQSLIIDLRGNPGGLLDVALQVANHFIDDGVLVSTRGRAWGQSFEHSARPRTDVWQFPLVVLVDGDSASASEIFAGAIKDHQRGWVVGTRSYGKGSVQSIFPLRSANTGLRLTTAYFYSPTGKVYQNSGVEPDYVVSRPLDVLGEEVPISRTPSLEKDPQLLAGFELLSKTQQQQVSR